MFAFFLLVVALISNLPSTPLAFVVDTDGNILSNGGIYYILPTFRGMGGGIESAAIGDETCPLSVVQARKEVSKGLPVRISSLARIGFLHENLPLYLSFTAIPTCATPPAWWNIVKGLPEGPSVKITGSINTVDGWFYIKQAFMDYKLVFCVTSSDNCFDIGVYIDDDGNRLLVPTKDRPLIVQFQKVPDSSAHAYA